MSKEIKLDIQNRKLHYNNNILLFNKNYLRLGENNIINICENINYDIYFPVKILNKINYITIVDNHKIKKKILKKEESVYNIKIGENNIISNIYSIVKYENNNIINNNLIINKQGEYTYNIYEYDVLEDRSNLIISGIINVEKELIYDIIKYNKIDNIYYIETLSKNFYINKKFDEQPNIIFKKKYNYLIKIKEENNEIKNYELKIYKDNIDNSNYTNIDENNNNKIITDNINNKYKFKIGDVIGLILLEDNLILNYKYDDMTYKKIIINEKMIYKSLDYINKEEVKLINNKINYITYGFFSILNIEGFLDNLFQSILS